MPATVSQIRRTARVMFRWCVVNGNLDERRARLVLEKVLQLKRRGYLSLLTQFKRLVMLEQTKRTALVHSATPLAIDVKTRVRNTLQDVYGERIHTQFADDRNLIGGIRIQVGSDVYDGSLKSRLAALARSFGIPDA